MSPLPSDGPSDAEERARALRELRTIPGVGRAVSQDLWALGVRRVADLRGADPQALYDRLCVLQGMTVDRCMLYVFRCAVHFASAEAPEPESLKWWNWMDERDGRPA